MEKKYKVVQQLKFINFEGNKELLIQGMMFSEYNFDSYKTKKTKESIELNFSEDLDIQSNEVKKRSCILGEGYD